MPADEGAWPAPAARRARPTAGQQKALERLEKREVRSFEAEYVLGLLHLDFHMGKRRVVDAQGRYNKPVALAVVDDRSRLCCHMQWYLAESAENLIHGLCQAFAKRGLPRALMTDNGSAMLAHAATGLPPAYLPKEENDE